MALIGLKLIRFWLPVILLIESWKGLKLKQICKLKILSKMREKKWKQLRKSVMKNTVKL